MMIDYTDDGDEDGYDDVDDVVPLNKNLNFPQFCLHSKVPKKVTIIHYTFSLLMVNKFAWHSGNSFSRA